MVGLAVHGAGVWALVAGALVKHFTQNLIVFWLAKWRPGFRVGGKRFKQVLRFSVVTLGHKMCWVIYHHADNLILGKVSGESVLGFYKMAKDLALIPVERVSTAVNQLVNPLLAALQDDQEKMRSNLLRAIRFVAYISFPICIGIVLVAKDLVFVALGEKWLSTVPLIQILTMYALFQTIATLLPPVLSARFRPHVLLLNGLVLVVAMPLAFYFGATFYGNGLGTAIAWVTVYPAIMFGVAFDVFRELQITIRKFFHYLWGPLSATFFLACAVYLTQQAVTIPGPLFLENSLFRFLLSVVVGSLSYLGVVLIYPPEERLDILKVLGCVCGTQVMIKIAQFLEKRITVKTSP